jgi:hypothetical protein
MLNIDVGLRMGMDNPTSRSAQLASFDKYPIGAFAVTVVQLSITLPEWWSDSAMQPVHSLRSELLSRLKMWEPIVGGALALRMLVPRMQNAQNLIEFFWHESALFDSENTVCFD